MPGDLDDLAGRDVEEHRTRGRQLVERLDSPARDDFTTERAEIRREALAQILRPAPHDRPADRMAGEPEDQADRRRGPVFQRQDRMRGQAGDQGFRRRLGEPPPGQASRGLDGAKPETRRQDRMTRDPEWPDQIGEDRIGVVHEGAHQPSVRGCIPAQGAARPLERSLEDRRSTVVERMRQRNGRVDQLQAVIGQRQRLQERRRHGERVHGRADVVEEAGEGQRRRPGPAADRRGGLDHQDRVTLSRHGDRRGQAIRAGAHDDSVVSRPR